MESSGLLLDLTLDGIKRSNPMSLFFLNSYIFDISENEEDFIAYVTIEQ